MTTHFSIMPLFNDSEFLTFETNLLFTVQAAQESADYLSTQGSLANAERKDGRKSAYTA